MNLKITLNDNKKQHEIMSVYLVTLSRLKVTTYHKHLSVLLLPGIEHWQ